jgi:uncharacterized paraquat-inducible protein A
METRKGHEQEGRCHRCLEAVPLKATRCPRCGIPIRRTTNLRLILGIAGLLMFVGVVVMAIRLMQTAGSGSGPDTSSGASQREAPPPEKKPALGQ